ncbi:MAG TPA: hypothetical protein VHL80_19585, partial [Polyangia bacterium]|nr:hypothetical protein [Polyangia bacterium]
GTAGAAGASAAGPGGEPSGGSGGPGAGSRGVSGSGCAVDPAASAEARWLWVLALGLAIRRGRRHER